MMMIRTVLDGVRNWRDTTAGLLPRVIAAAAADADQLPSGGAAMDLGVYTDVLGLGRQPAAPGCVGGGENRDTWVVLRRTGAARALAKSLRKAVSAARRGMAPQPLLGTAPSELVGWVSG